jgi:hypothetical protein
MATLVACDRAGSFLKIDVNNGTGTMIGPTGFSVLNSLARDSTGALYSVSYPDLIRIDPNTGAGTSIAKVQYPGDFRALAFSSAGTLYGIVNGGGLGQTEVPDDLVTIDMGTGVITAVGNTGHSGVQGLAFASDGTLYGWDVRDGLLTINLATGAASLVNPGTKPTGVDIQSIAFAPDGRLYGARNNLYAISISNGATTLIGSGGYSDVRGIEFLAEQGRGCLTVPIVRYTWLWTILIGYILITPIGPLCIVCGDPLSGVVVRALGLITMALGGVALMNQLSQGQR